MRPVLGQCALRARPRPDSSFPADDGAGALGQALYRHLRLPTDDYETMLLIEDGRMFADSDAVIGVWRGLGWPWRAAAAAAIVPRWVRDPLYRFVARNRFRLFGRRDLCWTPTPEIADRIL